MTYEAAQAVLKGNSIGFAEPDSFNDPFELHVAYPSEASHCLQFLTLTTNNGFARTLWSRFSGILCLTRNPLNLLMWSHYGDRHNGVVLGIDVIKAGFTDMKKCVIPAQYGNVIYTQTRPVEKILKGNGKKITIGETYHFSVDHLELLNRLFLTKPQCWAYEEEVRVVKCLKGIGGKKRTNKSGEFDTIEIGRNRLHCYKLPGNSIKEIYFGARHPASNLLKNNNLSTLVKRIDDLQEGIQKYVCKLSLTSWSIASTRL